MLTSLVGSRLVMLYNGIPNMDFIQGSKVRAVQNLDCFHCYELYMRVNIRVHESYLVDNLLEFC